MGYVANIHGGLKLKNQEIMTNEDLIKEIESKKGPLNEESGLKAFIDYNGAIDIAYFYDLEGRVISIIYEDNYLESEWYDLLHDIQDEVEVGSEIECEGEDGSEWRFYLTAEGWLEQSVIDHRKIYNMGIPV